MSQRHFDVFVVLIWLHEGTALCALLAASVALRSYAGMEMAFPWKVDIALAAGLVTGIVAGKAAGGVLADEANGRPREPERFVAHVPYASIA